ncbi:fatty acid desaturase [Pelagibius sp.]|uniref:fatty acid desaturase n=1 Tax=Pelagibius sp. TaxID=1931238 RepID=UPI003B5126F3
MEEDVYRNDTIDKQALKALAVRSDAKGLAQATGHLGLLAVTGGLVLLASGPVAFAAAALVHGIVLVFLFAPLHEAIHRTAFASRRLNDAVAAACGFLLLLPAGYFRAFHFEHHRFTQDPLRDPELAGPPISSIAGYLLHVSGASYWRERLGTLLRHAGGRVDEGFVPPRQRPATVREARWHCGLYGALLAGSLWAQSPLLLMLWVLPMVLGQPFLRLFLLAEHSGCPQTADMLRNSRTTETHRALRWLCWNMNRHTAHHAYPALPFHALPAADLLLAPEIAVRGKGYGAVNAEILPALLGGRAGAGARSHRP